jgi:serine/threonine-protein kinase RsbW
MSGTPESIETVDVVTLVVPGRPEYLRMARLAAADCGARAGLTIEDIEDLRIAVDELAYALIGDGVGAGALTLRYLSSNGAVEVLGECAAEGDVVVAELSRTIIGAVVDEHAVVTDHGTRRFNLVKRSRS